MKNPEDMTPDEIRNEISELQAKRGEIDARLGALRIRLALIICPYRVGEELVNRHGVKARISEIVAPSGTDEFEKGYGLRGFYLKKDGEPQKMPGRSFGPRYCAFAEWEGWERPKA